MSSKTIDDLVLTVEEWNPKQLRFGAPRKNKFDGTMIPVSTAQRPRGGLYLTTPPMINFGIGDYTNPLTQEKDGKFTITLAFPNDQYKTPVTTMLLEKLQVFSEQLIDAAVENSEAWWGESIDRAILKHNFNPLLKFSKVKGPDGKPTKKPDMSKPPMWQIKVPFYEDQGEWRVEVYDTRGKRIFPCADPTLSPADFVPRLSSAACCVQCGGIWIGPTQWGVTWKLVQCVVKPKEAAPSVFGQCRIKLSSEESETIDNEEEEEAGVKLAPATSVGGGGNGKGGSAVSAESEISRQTQFVDDEHDAVDFGGATSATATTSVTSPDLILSQESSSSVPAAESSSSSSAAAGQKRSATAAALEDTTSTSSSAVAASPKPAATATAAPAVKKIIRKPAPVAAATGK